MSSTDDVDDDDYDHYKSSLMSIYPSIIIHRDVHRRILCVVDMDIITLLDLSVVAVLCGYMLLVVLYVIVLCHSYSHSLTIVT